MSLASDASALLSTWTSLNGHPPALTLSHPLTDPTHWHGIKVGTISKRVIDVDWYRCNLSGSISSASAPLSLLTSCEKLSLGQNRHLHGRIPDLSPLKNLRKLWLDATSLQGPFPAEACRSLTSLRHLSLPPSDDNAAGGRVVVKGFARVQSHLRFLLRCEALSVVFSAEGVRSLRSFLVEVR